MDYSRLLQLLLGVVRDLDFRGAQVLDFRGGGSIHIAVFAAEVHGTGDVALKFDELPIGNPEGCGALGVVNRGAFTAAGTMSSSWIPRTARVL